MLVLQAMHGLSLAQTEYLVAERLSWMRFCGVGPGDAVPDANTLWDFRKALIAAGAIDALFARLGRAATMEGATTAFRNEEKLTSQDREFVQQLIDQMADKRGGKS
ncbi:transposase [Roseibium denhamense]|uniref:transposase n=1 Tax=Roseibium denhamense TaxID=76305 RepID=UPI001AD8DC4D|nr:transposase [Roseibium denhamense]